MDESLIATIGFTIIRDFIINEFFVGLHAIISITIYLIVHDISLDKSLQFKSNNEEL